MDEIRKESLDLLGPISPSIARREKIELGRESLWYFGQFEMMNPPKYRADIKRAIHDSQLLERLDDSIKVIITIPVHIIADYDKIYGLLSLYAQQKSFNIRSALIVIDLNWKNNEKHSKKSIDNCLKEAYEQLEQARIDFPELKIAVFEQPDHDGIFYVAKELNDIVIIAIHLAIKAKRLSSDSDILIIRNDADVLHMHQNYLSAYMKAAKENPHTPIFLGTTWFDLEHSYRTPGFAAIMTFDRMVCIAHNIKGNIYTAGGNFAYRARHFAAVDGMGYNCQRNWLDVGSDDFQIGYRLRMAFFEQSEKLGFRICAYAPEAIIDADGSRIFNCYAADNDYTIIDAYGTRAECSFSNSAVRPKKTANFIEKIDDKKCFDRLIHQFELEISDYMSFYGLGDEIVCESIDRLFETDATKFYTVEPPVNPLDPQSKPKFKLNDAGRDYYKNLLRRNYGDGEHCPENNKLVQAIKDGVLLKPKHK